MSQSQTTMPCTPAQHANTSNTKPVRLLALGDSPHGKTVLCEFPEGWQRSICLPTQADAWHPLFSALTANDRGELRKHTGNPIIRHPDGTRTRKGALSFITEEISRNGGFAGVRSFDVPAEEHGAGYITGYRCAAELLQALQRGYGPHISVRDITEAAMQASNEKSGTASRRSAGYGFLAVLEDALRFTAQNSNHGLHIAQQIAEAERMNARNAEQDAREKAAFVQRMKAAKAEKRSTSTTARHRQHPATSATQQG
ncbi:hypothetical protein [Simplicispira psychrophila]|uniref:hypothetical protein n=1 Tax=Simplicispira psychrophila TaxID=80882 RepID=UPI0004843FD6|nr:hypothetical protein [Simplicispira psychrophila]